MTPQIQGSLEDDDKNQLEYTSSFPGFRFSQSHQAAVLKGCDKSSLGSSNWAAKCKEYTFDVDLFVCPPAQLNLGLRKNKEGFV